MDFKCGYLGWARMWENHFCRGICGIFLGDLKTSLQSTGQMKHPSSFLKYLLPRSYIIFTSLRAHCQKPLVSKLPSPSHSSPLHKEMTSSKRPNNIPFSSSFPNLNIFRFPLPSPDFPNTVMTNDNKNDEVKTALSISPPAPDYSSPEL